MGQCNEALHHSPTYCDNILDSWINDQVCTLFSQGLQAVLHDAFAPFQKPLNDLLQHSKDYKEHWVTLFKAAMKRKQTHEHGVYLSKQQGMH